MWRMKWAMSSAQTTRSTASAATAAAGIATPPQPTNPAAAAQSWLTPEFAARKICSRTPTPYFHTKSFDEIVAYTNNSSGNGCAVQTSTGNSPPVVSARGQLHDSAKHPFYSDGDRQRPERRRADLLLGRVRSGSCDPRRPTPERESRFFARSTHPSARRERFRISRPCSPTRRPPGKFCRPRTKR